MAKHTLSRGKAAFLDYYTRLFPTLDIDTYLSISNPPVLLVSPIHESEIKKQFLLNKYSWIPLSWFPHAIYWPKDILYGTSLPGFKEGWLYSLNPSSFLPVLALNPQSSDTILDACAAPGGKTLATQILGHPTIVAADASLPRFKRLRSTLKLFGFPEIATVHSSVQALPYKLTGQFDKILLDAPCSSEKHVYNSKRFLKIWSENKITTLSHLQQLLVNTLLPLLKPGGLLVYSTCALNPSENEEVVSKTLSKHPNLALKSMSYSIPPSDPMFIAILQNNRMPIV